MIVLDDNGIVHSRLKFGSYNSEEYIEFLKQLKKKLDPRLQYSLYQDGARFHTTKKVI